MLSIVMRRARLRLLLRRSFAANTVNLETGAKSELQNAIEVLRDPSHVRNLPPTELLAPFAGIHLDIERQGGWTRSRELEEWFSIVAYPDRVAALRACWPKPASMPAWS